MEHSDGEQDLQGLCMLSCNPIPETLDPNPITRALLQLIFTQGENFQLVFTFSSDVPSGPLGPTGNKHILQRNPKLSKP